MPIKILLVDDHRVLRDGLKNILQLEKDLQVIAEANDGITALEMARIAKPDVVIMDITMPNMNGITATGQMVKEMPWIRVIALSMHSDRHFIAMMMNAGARGYLRKDFASDEVIHAIRAVTDNRFYVSKGLIPDLPSSDFAAADVTQFLVTNLLTLKEQQVLQLVAEGRTTKEIAFKFKVSSKTIDKQRARIMEKLGLFSVAELTKYALREGLTPPE
jgi:DNA-binding NarL/FixJ family response regulator